MASSLGFVAFATAFMGVVWGLSKLMTDRNSEGAN